MRHKRLIAAVVVVAVVIVSAAAVVALSNSPGETAAGDVRQGRAVNAAAHLVMRDDTFQPTTVTVPAGSPVEIEVRNEGQANHNLTSEAVHVSTGPMHPGDVMTISVAVPKGTTRFVCTWHPGMVIDIVGRQA